MTRDGAPAFGGGSSATSNNSTNNYINTYNSGYNNHGAFARSNSISSSSVASSFQETLSDATQESCDVDGSSSSSSCSSVAPFAMAATSATRESSSSLRLNRSEEGAESDVSLLASASDDRIRSDLSASSASSSLRPRRADGDPLGGKGKGEASAPQKLEALLEGMGGISPKRRVPHKKDAVGACGSGGGGGNAARKPSRAGGDGGRLPFGLVGSIARTIVEEEEGDLAESESSGGVREGARAECRDEGEESGGNGGNGGIGSIGGNNDCRDQVGRDDTCGIKSTADNAAEANPSPRLGDAPAGGASAAVGAVPSAAAAATTAAAAAAAAIKSQQRLAGDPTSTVQKSPVPSCTHTCRVTPTLSSPRNVSGCITGGLPPVAAASVSYSEADTEEWAGATSPGCLCEVHPVLWKVQTSPRGHGHGNGQGHGQAHGHGQQNQLHKLQTIQAGQQQQQQQGEEWSISPPGSPQATLSGVSAYFCGLPGGCMLKRTTQQQQKQQQRQPCASCKRRVAASNPPRCLRCRQAVYCSSRCLSRHLNAHARTCPGMRASRAAGSKRLGQGLGRVIVVDDDGNECGHKEENRIPGSNCNTLLSAAESTASFNSHPQILFPTQYHPSVELPLSSTTAAAAAPASSTAAATCNAAAKKSAAAAVAATRAGATSVGGAAVHTRSPASPSYHVSSRSVISGTGTAASAVAAAATSTVVPVSAATGVQGLCVGVA
ncbi:hypothetical protein CLOM_g17401 [Closterium sp. NIES-68]|nr:hypothetical protein CLOM_g17401 [Closterium sp. NIES-68]